MNQKRKFYSWGLPAALGALLVLLGGLAIAVPLLATLEISWLLAVVLIVSGMLQMFHAFQSDPLRNRAGRLLLASLALVAGLLVARNPIIGASAITLVMAFYFLATSAARLAIAFESQTGTPRGWLFASSAISLFLGIYLISTLSVSSLVIPGLFLGVDLAVYGIALITLGATLRKHGVIVESVRPSKAA